MEDKATFYAYLMIHDFFDCFVFDSVIRDTNTIIHLTAGHKIWEKEQPGDVVFHIEKVVELYSAAYVIHDGFSQREEVIINEPSSEPPDIYKTKWYFDGAFSSRSQDAFGFSFCLFAFVTNIVWPFVLTELFCHD